MNMLNEKLAERSAKLATSNMFMKLDYQLQEDFKNILKSNVETLSKNIETALENGIESKSKIMVEFNDCNGNAMIPQARSVLLEGEYIGKIIVNIGLIIHLYEMVYNLDYKVFVPDGKNVENIKKMMFVTTVNIILCHEVAHIYYNHGLLRQELLSKFGKDSIKYKLDMQTLEYDADAFAITKMYEHIDALQKAATLPQKKLYYQILVFSIHALIYLFRQIDEFDNLTEHPAFYIREIAMVKILNNLFPNQEAQPYIDFAEKEFNNQYKIENEKINSYYEKMVASKIHLVDIEKNYDSLKSEIKKFTRLPIEGIDYFDYRNL